MCDSCCACTHLASTQTVTHEYLTQSGKVMRETVTTNQTVTAVMDFVYDESGKPFAMIDQLSAQPKTYYYVLNLQGDVVKLIDQDGAEAAAYTYDAWGNILSQSGSMASANPLRYRGYYHDSETGFYYLQSRYYDPATRRFINADVYASTDSKNPISCNMFAYCENNPILASDPKGQTSFGASIGLSFWFFGWGFSVSVGMVVADDDIGVQASVAHSGSIDPSSQIGISGGANVSMQVTDKKKVEDLKGSSLSIGGSTTGFDAILDDKGKHTGWQLSAGIGTQLPFKEIHKIKSKTYVKKIMPTINLPKRVKEWVYGEEK